ncbi:MAG TPA: elongation factor P, partial [bacterium]|nr:elongation factor P [bacterium]
MNANDLRPGMVFLQNGELHEVITFQHVKPGKGPAYIKCKLRAVKTGKTFEISLRSSEKVEVIKMSE